MIIGSTVRVLPPFSETFQDTYVIERSETTEDAQTVYYLVGIESAFTATYLEVV